MSGLSAKYIAFIPKTVARPWSSAGVVDSTGRLVRTVWAYQFNDPRVSNPVAAWDGTDDQGIALPAGNYSVKLIQHNMHYEWEGVIGNSSHRADMGTTDIYGRTANPGTIHYHTGSAPIWDMDISAAGDMFYTTVYDERWDTAHYTKTSDPQVTDLIFTWASRITNTAQHGVCTDGTLTYFARMSQGSSDSFCICCNSGDKSTYSGFVNNGESDHRLIGHNTGPGLQFITGQAVQQTGTNLAIARESLNEVWTLNKTDGTSRVKNNTWQRPKNMATNKVTDQFWLLFSSTGTNIDRAIKLNCDGAGNLTPAGVTITLVGAQALDIAVSPDGSTVLISMGDPISQVWAFNNSDGSVKTAFGTSGKFGQLGGYRNSPAVTNDKFLSYHIIGFLQDSITAFIAFAPDGSWWFGDPGNCRSLHFSAGNSPTFIERICFIPSFYNVGLCINDQTRLRNNWLEWKIDYSKTLDNGFNGSWTLVNNWSQGVAFGDPTYHLDQYQALKWFGTYSNGRTYATYVNSGIPFGDLFELTSTGPRNTGAKIPRGFKVVVRSNMDIYSLNGGNPGAAINFQKNQFLGFDGSNNPIWQFDMYIDPNIDDWPIVYNATTDTTFPVVEMLNNVPTSLEPLHNNSIPFYWLENNFGSGLLGYRNHLGGLDATTGAIKWEAHPGTPDNNGIFNLHLFNKQFCDAPFFSSDAFVGGPGGWMGYKTDGTGKDVVTFYKGESWGANQVSVWDHWHESGLHLFRWGAPLPYFAATNLQVPPPATVPPVLGDLMTPTVQIENQVMPATASSNFKGMPGAAGNAAWGGIAEANGNLYLYCSDEWYNAGIHRWRISNRSTMRIIDYPTTFNGTPTPIVDPTDHLAGLPFNTVDIPMPVAGWTRNFVDIPGSGIQNIPYALSATNVFVCDKHQSPCLTLAANSSTPSSADYQMKRTLTRPGSGNWYLQLNFMAAPVPGQVFSGNANNSQSAFIMEILDVTNKVITRAFPGFLDLQPYFGMGFESLSLWINNFVPIAGNGTDPVFLQDQANALTHTDQTNWGWARLNAVNTLRFEGTPGQVKVTYGGLPILQTVIANAPYEVGANMLAPAFFRMRYFIPNAAGFTGVNGGAGVCGTVTKLNFGDLV